MTLQAQQNLSVLAGTSALNCQLNSKDIPSTALSEIIMFYFVHSLYTNVNLRNFNI